MTDTAPAPGTLAWIVAEFRNRAENADAALSGNASTFYRDGFHRGWFAAVRAALAVQHIDRKDELSALMQLEADLSAERDRTANGSSPTPLSAQPDLRDGKLTALDAALRVLRREIRAAEKVAEAQEERRAVQAPLPWEDDMSEWKDYPRLPMDGDHVLQDFSDLSLFLGGDDTSFTGQLLRLIAKADPINLNQLSLGYPRHVQAYLMWRACAPIPVRTMLALLNATTVLNRMNGDRDQ